MSWGEAKDTSPCECGQERTVAPGQAPWTSGSDLIKLELRGLGGAHIVPDASRLYSLSGMRPA
jgi:hypothetical protein